MNASNGTMNDGAQSLQDDLAKAGLVFSSPMSMS